MEKSNKEIIVHGAEFNEKIDAAVSDELSKRGQRPGTQIFEEVGDYKAQAMQAAGIRVIETEEQAKELLDEVNESNVIQAAKSDDIKELEKQAELQRQLQKMEKAWDGMGRRGRRKYSQKTYGDKYRYSARVKRRLKGA